MSSCRHCGAELGKSLLIHINGICRKILIQELTGGIVQKANPEQLKEGS